MISNSQDSRPCTLLTAWTQTNICVDMSALNMHRAALCRAVSYVWLLHAATQDTAVLLHHVMLSSLRFLHHLFSPFN